MTDAQDTAVHTSALDAAEPDMFAGTEAAPPARHESPDLVIEIHGRLLHAAEVRSKPVGDGSHVRPVLCLDIGPPDGNTLRRRIHAEQVYTEATRKDAEARAATLKRGALITIRTTLVDMRTVFPHVQSVEVHHSPTAHPSTTP